MIKIHRSKSNTYALTICASIFLLEASGTAQQQRRDDPTRTTLPHVTQSETLSVLDATRLAGLDPAKDKYLSFNRDALESWFFVRDDRTAVALRRSTSGSRPASNQTTPPAYEWIVVPLPKM